LRKARLGSLYRPDVTLQQIVDAFLDLYQGASSSKDRLNQYLGKATARFGDERVTELNALEVSRWRATLPEAMRHGADQALRRRGQVAVDRAQRCGGRAEPGATSTWRRGLQGAALVRRGSAASFRAGDLATASRTIALHSQFALDVARLQMAEF
jgi:hypothetical protein